MCYHAMLIVTQLNENGIFGVATDGPCLLQYQHNGPIIETTSLKCFEFSSTNVFLGVVLLNTSLILMHNNYVFIRTILLFW